MRDKLKVNCSLLLMEEKQLGWIGHLCTITEKPRKYGGRQVRRDHKNLD